LAFCYSNTCTVLATKKYRLPGKATLTSNIFAATCFFRNIFIDSLSELALLPHIAAFSEATVK
jgi:hypothetical protein